MQLLRTILIILIVYYFFRLIARYVMPWIARYVIRKSMGGFQGHRHAGSTDPGAADPGRTKGRKGALDSIGEYVEYEEVNDDKTKKS